MTAHAGRLIGLMSGTSLDGVDGVLVDFDARGQVASLLAHHHLAFDPALRASLFALQSSGDDELHRAALAANAIADRYARTVDALIDAAAVDRSSVLAIGAHGQTVRHRPELGYTWQLNNPAALAEMTTIPVVADFRARDIAAGGEGAPLVPGFHRAAFARSDRVRLVVNIGGIANITRLLDAHDADGYDIGPGNVLLDFWTLRHLGEPYDKNGAWASIGEVDPNLLDRLLDEPYFAKHPPKSTGRDLFHEAWLNDRLVGFDHLSPEDVQRTLVELTATLIAREAAGPVAAQDIIVCGGGARNATLMEAIARHAAVLPGMPRVGRSDDFGVAAEHVEALAFAWLAWCHINDVPGNWPDATGAEDYRVLGHYTPA